MIVVNGVRYRDEDAPKPLPDTGVAGKSRKPVNKARKPADKAGAGKVATDGRPV